MREETILSIYAGTVALLKFASLPTILALILLGFSEWHRLERQARRLRFVAAALITADLVAGMLGHPLWPHP
jgi:membrane-anchored protein YejM (alkaline phosphatase superfamily)